MSGSKNEPSRPEMQHLAPSRLAISRTMDLSRIRATVSGVIENISWRTE
jgi:hypothetical protein